MCSQSVEGGLPASEQFSPACCLFVCVCVCRVSAAMEGTVTLLAWPAPFQLNSRKLFMTALLVNRASLVPSLPLLLLSDKTRTQISECSCTAILFFPHTPNKPHSKFCSVYLVGKMNLRIRLQWSCSSEFVAFKAVNQCGTQLIVSDIYHPVNRDSHVRVKHKVSHH